MTSPPRHFVAYLVHPDVPAWTLGPAQGERLCNHLEKIDLQICDTKDGFLEALPGAEVALVWSFRQEWLERAPRLRWIATPAAGKDYFRITPPPTVEITYGRFHGELMGETVLGMMLGASRGLFQSQRIRHEGDDPWPRAALAKTMRTLGGSTVAILGFGRIGAWIGKLAKPFGARILGFRRHPASPPPWFGPEDRLLPVTELDAMLPETDHLVLALPGASETDRILDRRRLGLLPPHAWVHNVGRGNAVDEDALADSLTTGKLGGACLDVFAHEPLPETSPLRHAPGAVLMPHASAIAPQYLDLFLDEFAEDYRRRYGG